MCALRWTDIDLDRGEVRHPPGDRPGRRRGLREKDTKTHQCRRVALDEATVAVLRQHRLPQREQALALGVRPGRRRPAVRQRRGPAVATRRVHQPLRPAAGQARPRRGCACTTSATSWRPCSSDGGIPIATISARLGHSEMSTTLNIYTHAIPATDQIAADYLGGLLDGERAGRPERR